MIFKSEWVITASILVLALVMRLSGAVWWQARLPTEQKFYFGDSLSYWELAGDIAAQRDYEYQGSRIFRTPGYSIVLAPLFIAWQGEPPILVARAWNAMWGTAAVGILMWLARMHFDARVMWTTGLFAAVLPEAIAGSVFVLSEAAFVPVMLLQLVFTTQAQRLHCNKQSSLRAFLAGACGGLATLIRPSWLLFTLFQMLVVACFKLEVFSSEKNDEHAASCNARTMSNHTNLGRRVTSFFLPLLGLCLVMLPWWIRNYGLSGKFVPTSSEVGASLYDGLNPHADGSSNMDFKVELEQQFAAADVGHAPDQYVAARELRRDHFYRQQSLTWSQNHPSEVLRLAGIKFLRLWSFLPNARDFNSLFGRLLIACTYGPILALALFGCCRFLPTAAASQWLLLLPAIYLTPLHLIFVSSLRYRLPALLPLLILAAAAAIAILETWKTKTDRTAVHPNT